MASPQTDNTKKGEAHAQSLYQITYFKRSRHVVLVPEDKHRYPSELRSFEQGVKFGRGGVKGRRIGGVEDEDDGIDAAAVSV